mmetsp:Transcript_134193/g.261350  ORF Transcript_134193/g.261350 Transcript_134193/m.261350 type:complete len:92 (-) Transcript_134193:1240-1515(-)
MNGSQSLRNAEKRASGKLSNEDWRIRAMRSGTSSGAEASTKVCALEAQHAQISCPGPEGCRARLHRQPLSTKHPAAALFRQNGFNKSQLLH